MNFIGYEKKNAILETKIMGYSFFFLGFFYSFRSMYQITEEITLFTIMLGICYLLRLFFLRRLPFRINIKLLILLLFVIVYPLISGFLTLIEYGSFEYKDYLRVVEGIMVFVLLSEEYILKSRIYRALLTGFVCSTFFTILLSYENVVGFLNSGISNKFLNIAYSEYNYAASYYIISISYLIIYLINNKLKFFFKLLIWIVLSIIVMALLLTMSRAAYGSLFLVLFGFVFIYLKKNKKSNIKKLKLLSIIAFLCIIVLLTFNDIFQIMIVRFSNFGNSYSSGIDPRFYVWKTAFETFFLNPFGIGINNIRYYTTFAIPEHNTILQVMSTYGYFSFILFIIMVNQLVILVRTITYGDFFDDFLILIILSYIPFLLFLNLMAIRHFWVVLALLILRNYYKKNGVSHE